jgi:transcriptional regulator with XRE-family HTH domain
MGTTESVVSRLESGRVKPSTRTLQRYAAATGHRLRISLEPTISS